MPLAALDNLSKYGKKEQLSRLNPKTMRTSQADFDAIARLVIEYISGQAEPISLEDIEQHFADAPQTISVGRVILQLLADQKLCLTEDRRVMATKAMVPA
ncbi:MAG: hypothetical protein QUV06_06265 [Cyanobium sp. CZS 48M]|nr:hypothetical protein [Cyanobium sp. CZS48M]